MPALIEAIKNLRSTVQRVKAGPMRVYFDLGETLIRSDPQLGSNLNGMLYQPYTSQARATIDTYVKEALNRYCQSTGIGLQNLETMTGYHYPIHPHRDRFELEHIPLADLGITDHLNRNVTLGPAPEGIENVPTRGMGPVQWGDIINDNGNIPLHWEESASIAPENPIRKCSLGVTSYNIDFEGGEISLNVEVFDTNPYRVTEVGAEIYTKMAMKKEIKKAVQQNLTINVKTRVADMLFTRVSSEEMAALECLREMVSESEFRRYIKYGFILVKGASGKVYQIFKNKSHCVVWYNGKVVEEICIRIKNEVKAPASDNVIAFKVMIEAGEAEFRNHGNVYKMAA